MQRNSHDTRHGDEPERTGTDHSSELLVAPANVQQMSCGPGRPHALARPARVACLAQVGRP